MKKIFSVVLIFVLIPTLTFLKAQDDLEETLSNISSDAAKSYVTPVVNGFGSNLNSGWFAYPPAPVKLGLTARLRVVANGTFFSDEDKNFSSTGQFRFTSEQAHDILVNSGITPNSLEYEAKKDVLLSKEWTVTFSGPTIVGSEDEFLNLYFEGDPELGIDPYEDAIEDVYGYLDGLSILPSPNLQLTVGTIMGTNLMFRWFPSIDIEDLGELNFFGIGFVHNANVWFKKPLPVDLSVGFYYQNLDVGDVFENSATQFSIYASKTLGHLFAFTPYIGLSTESSTTSVSYDYNYDTPLGPETARIDFDVDGENSFGFTVGFSAKLAVVNFNVDYKAAKSGTLTAGLSFGLL